MVKKLNGNIGWIIVLGLAIIGWTYSLGWQSQTIKANEKALIKKAEKAVVEECFRSVDQKLDMIIEQINRMNK